MEKIQTIFDRNWETDRRVNEKANVEFDFEGAVATEKLDGTNIRLTVRSGTIVRVEKRRNPTKIQKQKGIKEPWYVDADDRDPQDKWVFDAVNNTDFLNVPDGEWSAEAIGKNIQANPLNLPDNTVFIFSLPAWRERITLTDVPNTYEALKAWLPAQKSKIGIDVGIEGIVWHHPNGQRVKIKVKDF
ncbi:MAG: hypothetical protein AAFX87_29130 [Bacteroidota bacterium]